MHRGEKDIFKIGLGVKHLKECALALMNFFLYMCFEKVEPMCTGR